MIRKPLLLHPFLFSIYFVFYFWSKNRSVPFSEVWPPLVFFFCLAVAAVLIFGIIFKYFKKAGIIVTLFFILLFSYGHAYSLLYGVKLFGIEIGRHSYLMILWPVILFLFAISIITIRKVKFINALTNYLNLTAMILVVSVLLPITSFQLKKITIKQESSANKNTVSNTISNERVFFDQKVESMPDIYYIILDSYMGSDVLKNVLGFNNSEFCEMLEKKGFFISSPGRSNYCWTALSLPSSLNFRYLDKNEDSGKQNKLACNNKVTEVLRSKGYKIISVPQFFYFGQNADLEYSYGPPREFLNGLVNTTWAYPLTFFGFMNSIMYNYQRRYILYQFEKLNEIPDFNEPTFTFAHIMNPHPPYIFDKEGKPLEFKLSLSDMFKAKGKRGDLWRQKESQLYIRQVIFLNKRVRELIDRILSHSPNSIIIIQGDHGQFLGLENKPSKEAFEIRNSILNAYYLPNLKNSPLYNGITPVNSFRVIFNSYFGENYELLPDVSYWSSSPDLESDFIALEKYE